MTTGLKRDPRDLAKVLGISKEEAKKLLIEFRGGGVPTIAGMSYPATKCARCCEDLPGRWYPYCPSCLDLLTDLVKAVDEIEKVRVDSCQPDIVGVNPPASLQSIT